MPIAKLSFFIYFFTPTYGKPAGGGTYFAKLNSPSFPNLLFEKLEG